MNIYQKINKFRKHYGNGNVAIERQVEKEINASPDRGALWCSLIFNADVEYQTIEQKKACAFARKNGVRVFEIVNGGINRLV